MKSLTNDMQSLSFTFLPLLAVQVSQLLMNYDSILITYFNFPVPFRLKTLEVRIYESMDFNFKN